MKVPQPKDKKGNHSFPINKHAFHKSIDVKLHMNRMKEKNHMTISIVKGYPERSVSKECACNARDPSSISGSGRSTGEEIGYPLQCSQASLVAQRVENLPTMWETWVGSLGWEALLATHSSILAWRIPRDRGAWCATVHGVTKIRTWLSP